MARVHTTNALGQIVAQDDQGSWRIYVPATDKFGRFAKGPVATPAPAAAPATPTPTPAPAAPPPSTPPRAATSAAPAHPFAAAAKGWTKAIIWAIGLMIVGVMALLAWQEVIQKLSPPTTEPVPTIFVTPPKPTLIEDSEAARQGEMNEACPSDMNPMDREYMSTTYFSEYAGMLKTLCGVDTGLVEKEEETTSSSCPEGSEPYMDEVTQTWLCRIK